MDLGILLSTVMVIVVLGAIVVAANYADKWRDPRLHRWVMGIMLLMTLALVALYGLLPLADAGGTSNGETAGILVLSALMGALCVGLLSESVRERLAGIFPRRAAPAAQTELPASAPVLPADQAPGDPLFPQMLNYYTLTARRDAAGAASTRQPAADAAPRAAGFDPRSAVHAVALVFCVYLLGTQFLTFVLEGGLEGVAEGFMQGLTAWDLVLNGLPLLVIPVLGVGFGIRRSLRQTLDRLGLGGLTLRGLGVAVAITVGLLVIVSIVGSTWQLLVPPETFDDQTQASDALADSVTTVWLALVLAASAAISEEIAFRGALQPIFGFWPTAVIFALTHMQYALTPATLIILGVAVAFAWIRTRYNTTVAIVTHFLYNFIPLALNVAIGTEALHWLIGAGLAL